MLDLGPGGGVNGGEVVAQGTPETVAAEERSFTGQYLREILARSPTVTPAEAPRAKARRSRRPAEADQPDLIEAK